MSRLPAPIRWRLSERDAWTDDLVGEEIHACPKFEIGASERASIRRTFSSGMVGRRRSSVDCSFDSTISVAVRFGWRRGERARPQLGNMTALADDIYPGEHTTNSPVEDINTLAIDS
jgi:hypothetical protein